jgi:2-C-methyl-D-erythritol 4-phosphate cytidylyltransferase
VTEAPGAIVPVPASTDPEALLAPVAGEEPLVGIVRALVGHVPVTRVVVAVPEPLVASVHAVLAARGLSALPVITAPAPGDRRSALRAALNHLAAEHSPVLIHDHRHPLTPSEVTGRVLEELAAGSSIVVPVVAVTDSIKEVDAAGVVRDTVDRATLRAVQYPRGFTAAALSAALAVDPTGDELDNAVAAGMSIAAVEGHPDAVCFTLPADAALLDAIVTTRR